MGTPNNNLMCLLEEYLESSDLYKDESDDESETESEHNTVTDWEILKKIKKGEDKTNNKNILLLEEMRLESNVFRTALEYYHRSLSNPLFKQIKFKNAVMCACVFLSFTVHCDPRDENSLIEYFKINKTKYTKGLKIVKISIDEVRSIQNGFENDLFSICKELNIIEYILTIKNFVTENFDASSSISSRNSIRMIKCILVYIYLILNKNIIPTIETFAIVSNISPKTVSKLLNKNFHMIDNNVRIIFKKNIELFLKELNKISKTKKEIKFPIEKASKYCFKTIFTR